MITTVSYWTLEALALWAYYILMRRCFPEKELDDELIGQMSRILYTWTRGAPTHIHTHIHSH